MEYELLIMRHGKSSWDTGADSDFDRTLSPRGIVDIGMVARRLVADNLVPDSVISSSAVRATQTTLRLCKQATVPKSAIRWDPNLYSTNIEAWIAAIRKTPTDIQRLMIIGHNPELEELLTHLAVQRIPVPDDGKLMATAALARLRLLVPWSDVGENCAALLDVTRPNAAELEID